MTLEQQLQQSQNENALQAEQLLANQVLIAQLVACIQYLAAQLAQNSQNSSKPLSSDGYQRSPKQCSLRKKSGFAPGAQHFCRIRGYLATLRKQGTDLLETLRQTLAGQPPLPAF